MSRIFYVSRFHALRREMRRAILSRQDSGSLIAEIVLNPEARDSERINKLRNTWHGKQFSQEVEERLRGFIKKYQEELPAYTVK